MFGSFKDNCRNAAEAMISLNQLTKRFGSQTAVDALSFEVPAGQIVGFLGPNGAGKSTTLRMLTGIIQPTSGSATICGFDLERQPLEVKRNVGFVPESAAVFESLTGLEYLEMVAALYGIPRLPPATGSRSSSHSLTSASTRLPRNYWARIPRACAAKS